jgi:hypothetical protein
MIKPDPAIIQRISRVSGVSIHDLLRATLAKFDRGLPLALDGLDPRDRHSFRNVVAQGWFPPHGTQACPLCVARDGVWDLAWRLPLMAACPQHEVFLLTECSACRMRFRSRRYSFLRSDIGAEQPCGNPVAGRIHCKQSLFTSAPRSAPAAVVDVTIAIARAMAGEAMPIMGDAVPATVYLQDLRHVASLLLHLVCARKDLATVKLGAELRREIDDRQTSRRNPRWGLSPPRSAVVRGHVLAAAADILGASSLAGAGESLATWIPRDLGKSFGLSNWMCNRVAETPTTRSLIFAAASRRHHVGRRIDKAVRVDRLPLHAVPHQLDEQLYRKYFHGLLGCYEWTGRLYASLCVARSVSPVSSWSACAQQIGLDPVVGLHAARAASGRMRCTPEEFAGAVYEARAELPSDRDFRSRERAVKQLSAEPDEWFDNWRFSTTPARRKALLPFAVTWMWREVAFGHYDGSPASVVATRPNASYRAFRDRLPTSAQCALRELVLNGARETPT